MDTSIKIIDGSIILSYSFIYDEDSIQTRDKLPKIENLLSYADRIFEKNKIYKYNNIQENHFGDITLRVQGTKIQMYKLRIEDVNILFFQNNMAVLYLKIVPDAKDLTSLYTINRSLTQFYTKQKSNDVYVYFGKNKLEEIKIPIEEFKEHIRTCLNSSTGKNEKLCKEILSVVDKDVERYEEIFTNKSIKLAKYKNKDADNKYYIKITPLMVNTLTTMFLDIYYPSYSPYNIDNTKEYPLSDTTINNFPGRVGITLGETRALESQKQDKRHYLYFENHLKIINEKQQVEDKYEFIHYDTFITSLILKYVSPNKKLKYYDNFNPNGTSYINSYVTLVCDNTDEEYEKNFISFEPFLNSKVSKGDKITKCDFFEVYQSQADMFTLGNSHSIVHILDKKAANIKNNKETTHFYTYLLTTVQRNFILNIINSSIVNINNIGEKTSSISDIKHTFLQLLNTMDKFNTFLTNYNFKVISNSSSVDNSYNFFRECNEVDKLTSQWTAISFKINDWKKILSHILQKRPIYLFGLLAMAGVLLKVFNQTVNWLLSFL